MKSIKKICVVTGSRADYGLLKKLMKLIQNDPKLELEIIVTGSHLSEEFGSTYKEIEIDGFKINHKVQIIDNEIDGFTISTAMGIAQSKIYSILSDSKPELLLVLGDRYEILSAVISALLVKVPVAHIHGGEISLGAFDDSIRNAVTKMSHLHFTATKRSSLRVIQMGEQPDRVFHVGGLGAEAIKDVELINKFELENYLGHKFGEKNLLITFNPETNSDIAPKDQIIPLINALMNFEDLTLIFTGVNADPGGLEIKNEIEKFAKTRQNVFYHQSLGQNKYLSCIKICDGVVGNSSSGLLEAPSFQKGTINIGKRQLGRELSESIINCENNEKSISESIKILFSHEFKNKILSTSNPYAKDNSSGEIIKIIKQIDTKMLLNKIFYDL